MLKSIETGQNPLAGNPLLVNGYLVYGEARRAALGNGFEAWYWLSHPIDESDQWETVIYKRFGQELYSPDGKAVVLALERGRIDAQDRARGRLACFPRNPETVDGFLIYRSYVQQGDVFYPVIEAERPLLDGSHVRAFRNVSEFGGGHSSEEALAMAKRINVTSVMLSKDRKGAIINLNLQ